MVNFLRFALEAETHTPGGVIDLSGMGLMALLVAGDPMVDMMREVLAFLAWAVERVTYTFERLLEYHAKKRGFEFRPTPLEARYAGRERDAKEKQRGLTFVLVLAVACVLAIGGAEYANHLASESRQHSDHPKKTVTGINVSIPGANLPG